MLVKWWQAYVAWCDRMGLTPENQRCCAPKLSEPDLVSTKQSKAEAEAKSADTEPLKDDPKP
ncbi:hypothetical protein [Shewanella sp.]|uniref:hypothetical protein n=1 Tax=Shewanella sp. TaxID=50422 RepID=UPI003D095EB4